MVKDFCARLGIKHPIFLGPFGRGGSTARLTAIVSNGGGLGNYGANELEPEQIRALGSEIRELTDKPFGINLWVSTYDKGGDSIDDETFKAVIKAIEPFCRELGLDPDTLQNPAQKSSANLRQKPRDFDAQVEAMLEVKPALFSFVFGVPDKSILEECRKRGILTAGAATTIEEARVLADAGVDAIVAAGFEGGGHRPSFLQPAEDSLIGTFALVPSIVDAVNLPVIAAGGIADGRGIKAAMQLGAEAVQIGTAFFACDESGASDYHRQLLFSESGRNTALTPAFTGRLARGLFNRFAKEMRPYESVLAKYPAQTWLLAPLKKAAIEQGRYDLINLWSGQAAPLLRHHKADELMKALIGD